VTLRNPSSTRGITERFHSVESPLWGDRGRSEKQEISIARWGCPVRQGGVVHFFQFLSYFLLVFLSPLIFFSLSPFLSHIGKKGNKFREIHILHCLSFLIPLTLPYEFRSPLNSLEHYSESEERRESRFDEIPHVLEGSSRGRRGEQDRGMGTRGERS